MRTQARIHTLHFAQAHKRAQLNKYRLPILCHSTPWRECIDKEQLCLINSLFLYLFLCLCLLLSVHRAQISAPRSLSDLLAESPLILCIYSKNPQKLWSILFGFVFDQFPDIWHVGSWRGKRVRGALLHWIVYHRHFQKRNAQSATVSSGIMCSWKKGQRVTSNHLTQIRLNRTAACSLMNTV